MPSGLLNINKPRLLTSHDVVNNIRKLTGIDRIGHAGTLDPLASGVLIICVEQATRIAEYLANDHKTYLATLRLGQETRTYDAESEVIAEHPWQGVTREALERTLSAFQGEIHQVPPMYSAVKHHGKPLYKFARRGITLEREARPVTIYAIEIVAWEPPSLVLRVVCSSGTYIRTLAHDIGGSLGCGAFLADLVRERSGDFSLEKAVTLEQLQQAGSSNWQRFLLPLRAGLGHLPGVRVDMGQEARIKLGQAVSLPSLPSAELAYALNSNEEVFAILRRRESDGLWQPDKVLHV